MNRYSPIFSKATEKSRFAGAEARNLSEGDTSCPSGSMTFTEIRACLGSFWLSLRNLRETFAVSPTL